MIPAELSDEVNEDGAPRVSGDDPPGSWAAGYHTGCSPRERG